MIQLDLFLNNQVQEPRKDYAELAQKLPFSQQSNTGMGILVQRFVELAGTSSNVVVDLQAEFKNCCDIKGDIARCFKFWRMVNQKSMIKSGILYGQWTLH
jgi:hypothetical protein